MKEDFICIGEIVRPRGLKGELKVHLRAKLTKKQKFSCVNLNGEKTVIENLSVVEDFAYFKLQGIDDIDKAETLRGAEIFVPRDEIKIEAGTYFVSEIIGADVFVDGGNIGKISGVLQYGSADVYVVKNERGEEISFPALSNLIINIDVEKNKMELDGKIFREVAVYQDKN